MSTTESKKRSAEDDLEEATPAKKQALQVSEPTVNTNFRDGLFSQLDEQREQYASSQPYKHGVISELFSDSLLRNVRSEILEHISFTPKETDIYRIDQSGDLANLDGLEEDALKRLPSLKTLRNALYSPEFRSHLSQVTGSGPLSGSKTDMAINVYTPGCHLLCHDDVIGSRRVSYILYLTDPDQPWEKEWGGALRLYPTQSLACKDGRTAKIPSPDFSVSIPPAFNQLSFFAVQPGESFHDVEEVYAPESKVPKDSSNKRVRMAISGWFHIPQSGEDGYQKGLEDELAKESSLVQLQGNADEHDLPVTDRRVYAEGNQTIPATQSDEDPPFSEKEFDFLIQYLNAKYLTPDTHDSITALFSEECSLVLENFLSQKFSDRVRKYLESEEEKELPSTADDIQSSTSWKVARPPHKHRFLYQQADDNSNEKENPIQELLKNLIPSEAFRKWLQLVTQSTIQTHNSLARRFRRGHDYTLAQKYDRDSPWIEICLSLTPTPGWGGNQEESSSDKPAVESKGDEESATRPQPADTSKTDAESSTHAPDIGGYLAYLAGDADEEENKGENNDGDGAEPLPSSDPANSSSQPSSTLPSSFTSVSTSGQNPVAQKDNSSSNDTTTGAAAKAHHINTPKATSKSAPETSQLKPKHDPAIYQANTGGEDEDPILFHMPATWNQLGIVLRDKGTMRFVKYVSRQAKGDRWDVFSEFEIEDEEDEYDDEEGNTAYDKDANAVDVEEEETEVEDFLRQDDDSDSDEIE